MVDDNKDVREEVVEDDSLYKGFDLSDYDNEDKVKALIEHLDLNAENDEIEESGDYYTVNSRKVKEGTSPQRYVETITTLKKLLTPRQREEINSFLKLLSVMEACECGKVQDKLYHKIDKALSKRRDDKNKDIQSLFSILEREGASNIVYHLLWLPEKDKGSYKYGNPEPDYVLSYREAWFGQPVKDRRKFSTCNDGEYRILTDSEADDACDDSLDYFWYEAVAAKTTTLGLDDWKEWVKDSDGRGPQLASYDSCENEQDIDGETYYIYQTN